MNLDAALSSLGESPTTSPATAAVRRKSAVRTANWTRGKESVVDRLGTLPKPGEALHTIIDGTFKLGDLVPAVHHLAKSPLALTVATLGINKDTVDLIAGMIGRGELTRLRIIFSHYFTASDKSTFNHAIDTFTRCGARVAVDRVHAKLLLFEPPKGRNRWVVESSANLRSCQSIEQLAIINDAGLFAFHEDWLAKYFA